MRGLGLEPRTHGHHIINKAGSNGGGATTEARDARDILLYYGINPYWDRANLTYAPLRGHPAATIQYMQQELDQIYRTQGATGSGAVVQKVAEFADRFIRGTLPGQ
jgi:hypothetical protein